MECGVILISNWCQQHKTLTFIVVVDSHEATGVYSVSPSVSECN